MDLSDVQAVIQSAKARGMGPLERFIRKRLPTASDEQVREAADVAVEIIETVPIFLARAAQEAEERRLVPVVQPLLDHAARYFTRPVDLIPEMTQGLAGLLDDTYLVLRILSNLEKGPEPFLEWDLDDPTAFLRGLVGEGVGRQLDLLSIRAMEEVSEALTSFWSRLSAEA
jgi:uncharacterized membrane protein YkvA (DUF1232 family)